MSKGHDKNLNSRDGQLLVLADHRFSEVAKEGSWFEMQQSGSSMSFVSCCLFKVTCDNCALDEIYRLPYLLLLSVSALFRCSTCSALVTDILDNLLLEFEWCTYTTIFSVCFNFSGCWSLWLHEIPRFKCLQLVVCQIFAVWHLPMKTITINISPGL